MGRVNIQRYLSNQWLERAFQAHSLRRSRRCGQLRAGPTLVARLLMGGRVPSFRPAAELGCSAVVGSGCIMSFWRDWVSWLLLALAIACFGVGAFPQRSEWIDPANGDQVSEWRCGLWFSPSYQHVRRDHLDPPRR